MNLFEIGKIEGGVFLVKFVYVHIFFSYNTFLWRHAVVRTVDYL
jgi:hypothetical protein